jgi:Carbohydrate esterase, sialic acid-specific acetylesterase
MQRTSTTTHITGTTLWFILILTVGAGFALAGCQADMVVGTGQSLSLGHGSYHTIAQTANPNGLMFASGTRAGLPDDGRTGKVLSMSALSAVTPLTEAGQEDMAAGLTENVHIPTVVVELGVSAQPYRALKKHTQPYANMLTAVLAANLRFPVAVSTLTVVHGEADEQDGTTGAQYEADLKQWHDDFCEDVKAITRQMFCPTLLTDQMSSWPMLAGHPATARIPYAQLQAAIDYPGDIQMVAPKYFLTYLSDGVHLTAESELTLGRYYAKARTEGDIALYPIRIVGYGRTIRIVFSQHSPLVLDDRTVTSPNGPAMGFEYYGDSGIKITRVTAPSGAEVDLTLSGVPTHPGRVRYAYTGTPGAHAGPTTGPRGCLRDSDKLPDWAVHFDMPVTSSEPVATPTPRPRPTPTPGPVW